MLCPCVLYATTFFSSHDEVEASRILISYRSWHLRSLLGFNLFLAPHSSIIWRPLPPLPPCILCPHSSLVLRQGRRILRQKLSIFVPLSSSYNAINHLFFLCYKSFCALVIHTLVGNIRHLLSRSFRSDSRNSPRTSATYPKEYQLLGVTELHLSAFYTHGKPDCRSFLPPTCDNAAIFGLNQVTPKPSEVIVPHNNI